MTDRAGVHAKGNGYGVCQRCGWKYDLSDLRREWTNLRVCPTCIDQKPPQLSPPRIGPEGLPSKNASPQPSAIDRPFDTIFDPVLFDTAEVLASDL